MAVAGISVAVRAAVLSTLVLGWGCVRHYPQDLQVELRGVVDREGIVRITGERFGPIVNADEAIVVDVSSRSDWITRAKRHVASRQLLGGFCDGRRVSRLTTLGVFANGALAGIGLPAGGLNVPEPDEHGRYVVQGFLRIRERVEERFRGVSSHDDSLYNLPFDLAAEPRDVCLHVRGGSAGPTFLPYVYESNVARIPREDIEALLRGADGEHPDRGRTREPAEGTDSGTRAD